MSKIYRGDEVSDQITIEVDMNELEAAYRNLDKAEENIQRMRRAKNKTHMVLELLKAGGYIPKDKLEQAERFCKNFYTD